MECGGSACRGRHVAAANGPYHPALSTLYIAVTKNLCLGRVPMPPPGRVDDLEGALRALGRLDVMRPDRDFSRTARNVEHISGLAQARIAPAQRAHERLALIDGRAQMRGAGREIAVMQVVGLDAALDERAHERTERRGIVVDALEQHRLTEHRDSGVDQARAGGARVRAELPGMVDMQHDVARLAGSLERARS